MAKRKLVQTGTPACTRARKTGVRGRKPGRTEAQLERQDKVFMLHLQGISVRKLAKDFRCSKTTIMADLRAEEARRVEDLGERRAAETARAIAVYQDIYRRALCKSDMYDEIVSSAMRGAELAALDEGNSKKADYQNAVRVQDHALDAALKAQERIDKIRGIDAPTKVEIGVQGLIDALSLKDGESEVRT